MSAIGLAASLFNVGAIAGGLFYTSRILANVVKIAARQNQAIEFLAARLADLERERANDMGENYRSLKLR